MENDYINSFSVSLEATKLFNLSSGVAVEDNPTDKILNIIGVGQSLAETFTNGHLMQHNISFHEPIKRNFIATFKDNLKSVAIKKDKESTTSQVNRNIISVLSYSVKLGRATDFERALKFSLLAVSLSIANGDGTHIETSKSKNIDVLTQREIKISHKHPVKTFQILSLILWLWFKQL